MTVIFRNLQQSNARAGQEKTHVFFGNAQPKSNARAHLKQRKKHSGLMYQTMNEACGVICWRMGKAYGVIDYIRECGVVLFIKERLKRAV